jgi:hypothetical protein
MATEETVIEFLNREVMIGIFPAPHRIFTRKYIATKDTIIWFTTYLWGVIFTSIQMNPYMDAKHIALFSIKESSN